MNRRALILNELGLNPVWVRHEVLAQMQEQEEPAIAEPTQAPRPEGKFSPIVQAAHQRMEETIAHAPEAAKQKAPSSGAAAIHQVLNARNNPRQEAARQVENTADAVTELDERALAIMQMDWHQLQEAISNCTACALCKTRTQAVFGVGHPQASLMVVGEAPGAEEDAQGEPFVGQAGKLLDNMLASIGHSRHKQVFVANVLKCRPPGNRNPQANEVAQCAPFLQRQIELVQPQVLFASGRFAISCLLKNDAPISALRGKVHQYRQIPVIVSYHPAYLLRNLPDKAKAWQDLLLLQQTLIQKKA